MRKRIVTVLIVALMLVMATYLSAPAAGERIKIGFTNLDETLSFCMDVRASMERAAQENDVDVVILDNASDPNKAVENVDSLILQGAQTIVVFNTDAATNQVIKEKCDAAGIPVMGVDIPVPDSPCMGADNIESGKLVGKELGRLAKEEWDGQIDFLLLIDLPRSGEVVKLRMDNIIVGLQEVIPEFEANDETVIRVDGKNDVLPAQQVTADVLTAHPDAKHILIGTLNDNNAQGSLAAIQAANREADCLMVSHGCAAPGKANFKGPVNCWRAGIGYFPERYGDFIIPAAIQLAKGETVPDYIPMVHDVINYDNINEFYPD